MQFVFIAIHISLYITAKVVLPASGSIVSTLVRKDALPNVPQWKTIASSSKIQCASYCQSTAECQSYYFGKNECGLLKKQYSASDDVLDQKSGFSYYHFDAKYEETWKQPTTPQETTTTPATTTPPAATTTVATTTTLAATTQGSKEYFFYSAKKSFAAAYEDCKAKHARLVCVHDDATWKKVLQILEDNKATGFLYMTWLGLNGTVSKAGTQYKMTWADGTIHDVKSSFNFWSKGDPDILSEPSCVVVISSNWNDGKCKSVTASYICEQP